MRLQICVVLVLFGWTVVSGCQNGNDAVDAEEPDLEVLEARIAVENFEYTRQPSGERVISGVLHNPTEWPIPHAEVQIGLYDSDNQQVEMLYIAVRDIEANGRTNFRRTIEQDLDFHGARVRQVLVFGRRGR